MKISERAVSHAPETIQEEIITERRTRRTDMRRKIARFVATGALTCSLVFAQACTTKTTMSTTVSKSPTGTTTVTVGIAVTIDPAGSDLAGFDTPRALANVAMDNANITSTAGTVTVTVSDASSGQVCGQQAFGYVVSGSSLYAQDPTAVHNWLTQFGSYSNAGSRDTHFVSRVHNVTDPGKLVAQKACPGYPLASSGWNQRTVNGGV
jgi:hypothetical protein